MKFVEWVEWCVDFLLIDNDMCLAEFIEGFLKLDKTDTNNLLEFMDDTEITEFGGSIICGWLKRYDRNPYNNRVLTDERREIIMNWIKSSSPQGYGGTTSPIVFSYT
jgi:hypothetical protein